MVDTLEIEKTIAAQEGGADKQETMIFNISLANWGKIISRLLILYVFLGAYFAMLFYIGLGVRKQDYIRIPSLYFGDFERDYRYPSISEDGNIYKVNIPKGCKREYLEWTSPSQTVSLETTMCEASKNSIWNVFPWTNTTKGLGTMNSCTFTTNSYVAFTDYPGDGQIWGETPVQCGNYIHYAQIARDLGYTVS